MPFLNLIRKIRLIFHLFIKRGLIKYLLNIFAKISKTRIFRNRRLQHTPPRPPPDDSNSIKPGKIVISSFKKTKKTDRYQYISCEEVTKATLVMARESGGGGTDYTTEDDNTHLLPPLASWRLDIEKFRLPRESHRHRSHDRVSSFSLDRLLPTSSTHYLISSLDLFSQLFVFLLRYCSCYFNYFMNALCYSFFSSK